MVQVEPGQSAAVLSKSQGAKLGDRPLLIAITGAFTAEPVAESLAFWLQELNIQGKIEFAPYNQVFQQLLDPASLLSNNHHGVNVVLVRLEDWQRYSNNDETAADTSPSVYAKIEQTVLDFVLALKAVAARTATPNLVYLCPSSPSTKADPEVQAFSHRMETLIVSELAGINGLYIVPSEELIASYPVATYYNPEGDELGHIPYVPLFFAALGTVLARKIYAIQSPPHKVIVLDCDQTLWKGVCGEDGVMGIELDPPRKALHDFMAAQYEAGMLICLCSKNNEEDVVEVFERCLHMPLKRHHIVSWRINWNPKSENLKSLAEELNLGLDSFIFIDDNPVECAEVQANCPEVLTLQLPQNPDEIPRFIQHIWAFDRLRTTAEDQQRTSLYRQNLQRQGLQSQALNLEDFLVGLGLEIKISPLAPSYLSRVAQLTQRTNQFNMTTIRRSEQEIHQCQSGQLECLIVEVCDRFGDYGLVGVILFATDADRLEVDTFLLSCRVLGRGVEHRMLAQLAEIAKGRGKTRVNIPYMPTEKNQPALNFLNQVGIAFKQPLGEGYSFQFPVEYARAVVYNPQAADSEMSTLPLQVVQPQVRTRAALDEKSTRLNRIATELYSAQQVFDQIESQKCLRPDLERPFVPPQTETEQQLAQIWMQLLRLDKVGIQDNFFELGGTSLLAVQLFTQIEKILGKKRPLVTLLQAPTIEQLSTILCQEEQSAFWSSLVALQPAGSKPPLFCIGGVGGSVLYFRGLSNNLGLDQPVYGLQAKGLDGKQDPHTRIEDMAADYIKEIRTFQPNGPYFLGGHSAGGLVALEMAQQLQMQGQKVALLALFDTSTPKVLNHIPSVWDQASFHLFNLRELEPKKKLTYVLRILKASLKYRIKNNSKKIASLVGLYSKPLVPQFKIPDALPQEFRRPEILLIFQVNDRAARNYVPQVYTGQVTLFKVTDEPKSATLLRYPLLGWDQLAAGGLEVHEVPGVHAFIGSLLSEPHVKVLAEKLKACLDKAQTDGCNPISSTEIPGS